MMCEARYVKIVEQMFDVCNKFDVAYCVFLYKHLVLNVNQYDTMRNISITNDCYTFILSDFHGRNRTWCAIKKKLYKKLDRVLNTLYTNIVIESYYTYDFCFDLPQNIRHLVIGCNNHLKTLEQILSNKNNITTITANHPNIIRIFENPHISKNITKINFKYCTMITDDDVMLLIKNTTCVVTNAVFDRNGEILMNRARDLRNLATLRKNNIINDDVFRLMCDFTFKSS